MRVDRLGQGEEGREEQLCLLRVYDSPEPAWGSTFPGLLRKQPCAFEPFQAPVRGGLRCSFDGVDEVVLGGRSREQFREQSDADRVERIKQ